MTLQKPKFQLPLNLDLPEPEEKDWVDPVTADLILAQAVKNFENGDEKPEWFNVYLQLRDGRWPARVAMYIAWASSPRKGRKPENVAELASLMGLKSPRAIYVWRSRNPAIDQEVTLMQAAPIFQHRADLFQVSLDVALSDDYKGFNDRKLLFEMLGDYVPRSQIKAVIGKSKKFEDMSDDDLLAMLGDDGNDADTDA
jgi:hypothetical protein